MAPRGRRQISEPEYGHLGPAPAFKRDGDGSRAGVILRAELHKLTTLVKSMVPIAMP